jgi:hypothetical protein
VRPHQLLESGRIVLDKPAAETSVEELTHIIVEEYRQARLGTPSELALA